MSLGLQVLNVDQGAADLTGEILDMTAGMAGDVYGAARLATIGEGAVGLAHGERVAYQKALFQPGILPVEENGGPLFGAGGRPFTPRTMLAGTAPNINPGFPAVGRTQNCVNCAIATDLTFTGRPSTALPSPGPKSILGIEQELGGKFVQVGGKSDIEHVFSQLGPGARGIVFGGRPNATGHVFNVVVNNKGAVSFFDGQTGRAASFGGFTRFRILITNAR
jgi:hypothetical protein